MSDRRRPHLVTELKLHTDCAAEAYTVEAVLIALIDRFSKLVSGETALLAVLVQDMSKVLNAYFNKYDTQIYVGMLNQ